MDLHLKDKRALVTGSSSGIGASIAQELAAEGAQVLVHGRNAAHVEEVLAKIKASGGRAFPLLGDISSDAGAAQLVAKMEQQVGSVDILVNNVGTFVNRTWEQATSEDWAAIYNANVLSTVRMVRLLVPAMRARGWGRIIQLGTGEATAPFPNMPDYSASKAALVNLTVSLSKALAGTGVTVNTVSPGIIVTQAVREWYQAIAKENKWGDTWAEIEQGVLRDVQHNTIGRLGHEDEVSALVAFLASPRAGYINGSNYRVDGGALSTVN